MLRFSKFPVAVSGFQALGCGSVHQDVDIPRTNSDRTLRATVSEAAQVLGISAEAVRQRIKRGTLDTEKGPTGTVYVLLNADLTRNDNVRSGDRMGDATVLISEMRGRIEDLRDQLEAEREANHENRRIIAALTSRIPELPPAPSQEPRESPVPASEGADSDSLARAPEGTPEPAQPQRPWWRRMFGG